MARAARTRDRCRVNESAHARGPRRTLRRTIKPQVSAVVLPWPVMCPEASCGRLADKLLTRHEGSGEHDPDHT